MNRVVIQWFIYGLMMVMTRMVMMMMMTVAVGSCKQLYDGIIAWTFAADDDDKDSYIILLCFFSLIGRV